MIKEDFNFLKVALWGKYPGAIARSSNYVVKDVLGLIKNRPLNQIIEYGPGDGVMTFELLKHLSPSGKLLAVEVNPKFLEMLRKIPDPRLQVIDGTMEDVSQNINDYNFSKVDLVVSSVPFSLLSKVKREKILLSTEEVLVEGGMFIIFHQYSNIMARPMRKIFDKVKTRFEFRNFLPCFIISAVKSL